MTHIAHFNVARLLHHPSDPRVHEFTSNTQRVNAVAERSPGFVWRLSDAAATVTDSGGYQAVAGDPRLAVSMSVWTGLEAFRFFVHKTVHGGFLRRREAWFEPWEGPNYVIWPVAEGVIPDLAEGWRRLDLLKQNGPSAEAYGMDWAGSA
jgi:hypothetical protein